MLHDPKDWFVVIGGTLVLIGTILQAIAWWKARSAEGSRREIEDLIESNEDKRYKAKDEARRKAEAVARGVEISQALRDVFTGIPTAEIMRDITKSIGFEVIEKLIQSLTTKAIEDFKNDLRALNRTLKISEQVRQTLEMIGLIFLVIGSALVIIPPFI